jgi:hypothetical protein
VDRDQGIALVVGSAQEHLELAVAHPLVEILDGGHQIPCHVFTLTLELDQDIDLFERLGVRLGQLQRLLQAPLPPQGVLGFLGLRPELGLAQPSLELLELVTLGVQLKENLEYPPRAP